MNKFTEEYPSIESYFRSLILFGKNSASYKFALAKTLIELSQQNLNTFISLEELSKPFASNICEHLLANDVQSTSPSSQFLNACRRYNEGSASYDTLIENTVSLGFTNVLNAFHNINQDTIPISFFEVVKEYNRKGIILKDELFALNESNQSRSFEPEIEARWRLVETAWSLKMNSALLDIHHDIQKNTLFVQENPLFKRTNITSARDALNGYQKGKCFYCFNDTSVISYSADLADVDHFFPHLLMRETHFNLNGIWNLVLACTDCNRGKEGKFMRIPELKYLERLHRRNEFFIGSHHPLKETILKQTGKNENQRISFLQSVYSTSLNLSGNIRWKPHHEQEPAF